VNFLRRLALQEKQLDDSSALDVVEIAGVPDTLPRLFPSWSGYGLISTSVHGSTASTGQLYLTLVVKEFVLNVF